MTARTQPPFRADQVGSLLRPDRLKQARERFLGAQTPEQNLAPHDNAELRAVEDECIREVVALQERIGLRAVTDGEFRRRSWWLELIMNWDGFAANREGSSAFTWRDASGREQPFSALWIDDKIKWRPSPIARAVKFLAETTDSVPKVTIPAPQVVHCFMGGDRAIRGTVYGDPEPFWDDLVAAYRQELAALIDAGAKYIQMDDTSIAFLCDPALRDEITSWGRDPDDLLDEYARRMNQVIGDRPSDVKVTLHQCRGNREGMWASEGGFDPVADVMFNQIDVDGYFLEYDSDRAGTFEPLRHLPAGKVVALGLVSTKTPALEDADMLKRRIEEAASFTPLDRLALAPQCGFASSVGGNPVTLDDQIAKLSLIVEVARDVWGDT
ncbi:MAG: 5-methyltetrahydropteroyltriglutamate--homocysteine S-methyltransferase [Alphaproteobacteria bacterium]